MGISERREREKERRRNDILDAAEKVFFSRGFNVATMDEIAEQAELSKGTLYLYFKSKEELYLGISQRAMQLLVDLFNSAVESQSTGVEKIRAIGEAYYRYSQEHSEYFSTIVHYELTQLAEMEENDLFLQCHRLGQQVMQPVAEAIRIGVADGSIRADLDPMKTAFLLQGLSNGVIQLIAREGEHIRQLELFNPEDLVEEFFALIFHALAPANEN